MSPARQGSIVKTRPQVGGGGGALDGYREIAVDRGSADARRGAAADTRCPRCGALNPADAQWCGQCLTRFGTEDAPPDPLEGGMGPVGSGPLEADPLTAPLETLEPRSEGPQPPSGAAPAASVPADVVGTERGAFKVTESGVVWRCGTCDRENPIDVQVCAACGSPFAATVAPEEGPQVSGDPGTAALLSLFFAGAGHAYLGLWPQAIARGVIHVWIVVTIVAGLLQTEFGGGVVAALFVLVALAFALVSAHDAFREAQHDPGAVLLKGRSFLYLVIGLLLLLMVTLVLAGMQGR
ncbi:MAG TPA: zinc ribbon domain-containing protein [Actinomycetota bacterium]|nr:zinc ribbon domain-containing protein [Actinomycetota bacterium]